MRETWVRSLGREDPLEKEMATHSSTLAWKIPWTEKSGRLQSMGSQRVGHDWVTSLSLSNPNCQDLMPDGVKWSWCNNRNKVHNKRNVFESPRNHPHLDPPSSMEKLSSLKPVPSAKKDGDHWFRFMVGSPAWCLNTWAFEAVQFKHQFCLLTTSSWQSFWPSVSPLINRLIIVSPLKTLVLSSKCDEVVGIYQASSTGVATLH